MLFKGISYLELWQPCSAERNHLCKFDRGYQEEQFCEIILNLVSGSGGDVSLKISYLEFWQSSCSVERNHLCNFERGHHGEHTFEVI